MRAHDPGASAASVSLIGRVLGGLRERPRRSAAAEVSAAAPDPYVAAQRALDAGDVAGAVAPLREILGSGNDAPEVHCNLGVALRSTGELDAAARHLRRAVETRPELAPAWYNLGLLEFERARYAEAAAAYRAAIEADPNVASWHHSLLALLNYAPGYTPQQVFEAHRDWAKRFAPPAPRTWKRAPRDTRRLRVGYVSADFRGHSVAFFIGPVLAHHDRSRFEVFCYDNHAKPDATTAALCATAEHWRNVAGLDDDALEQRILDDAIDVLVDLSGHTLGNRLAVFARKPAPVQATWIGYPQTTGLEAIDYRITDAYLDPPGTTESFGSEALLRLPGYAYCFRPPEGAPDPGPPPCLREGRVTFGSLNQYFKVTDEVVATWCRLLAAVPDAALRMIVDKGETADVARAVRARFAAHGVDGARIDVRARGDIGAFFRHLQDIDVALDPFPYNGGTTTYQTLWAGVPVVTRLGATAISRCTAMILSAVGLDDLVARDDAEYVELALELARDPARLTSLRAELRERYRASPLYAADVFTRKLESTYDEAWRAFSTRAGSAA